MLPFVYRNILSVLCYSHVSRTHDLIVVTDLFHAVSRPSCDSRDSEYRSEELYRKTEHLIYESTEKIYVRTDTLIDFSLFGDDLRRKPLDERVEGVFLLVAFGLGELLYISLEDNCTRI